MASSRVALLAIGILAAIAMVFIYTTVQLALTPIPTVTVERTLYTTETYLKTITVTKGLKERVVPVTVTLPITLYRRTTIYRPFTVTYLYTTTKFLTALEMKVLTKYLTKVYTKTFSYTVTTFRTKTTTYSTTLAKTVVFTKTVAITRTYRETVTKTVALGGYGINPIAIGLETVEVPQDKVEKVYRSEPRLGFCPMVRRPFNEISIAAALEDVDYEKIVELAQKLRVLGSPIDTALNIASIVGDLVKYRKDIDAFGVENCVLMPREALDLGIGDCEDRALLMAVLLLASGEVNEVYILDINFKETSVGHVEVAIDIDGHLYTLMPLKNAYLMELTTDYCGLWKESGLTISNITIYSISRTRGGFIIAKSKTVELKCYAVYPPPIDREDLLYLESFLDKQFETYSKLAPRYLALQYQYIDQKKLVYLPFFRVSIPIDWYSDKSPQWIAYRIYREVNKSFSEEIEKLLHRYGCGMFKAVISYREVKVYRYNRLGEPIAVKEVRPVIDLYLLFPYKCFVPRANVSLEDGYLYIEVEAHSTDVSILIYPIGSANPVLGIVPKGYKYQQIPYIEADEWLEQKSITKIKVSIDRIAKVLPKGTYKLVVWVKQDIVYVYPLELS